MGEAIHSLPGEEASECNGSSRDQRVPEAVRRPERGRTNVPEMTVMQSQYFAFIHAYTNVMNSRHQRRTCSDIRDVSADRHQMVLTLARKGFISILFGGNERSAPGISIARSGVKEDV